MVKRILVVDDDPAILEVVTDILRDAEYDVETASNGAEALDRMRQQRPDAVLLDLMMPVMDGWSFVAACRRDGRCAEVPIVIMSAARDAGAAAVELRAQGCVAKPFEIETLLDTVGKLSGPTSAGQ